MKSFRRKLPKTLSATRGLKLLFMYIALITVIVCVAYSIYLSRLTMNGYCHAQGKYLTDEEKIKAALEDLLKKYPSPVIRTPVSNGWTLDKPQDPISYQNVTEFLEVNPNCCNIELTEKFMEGGKLSFFEVITGTATNVVEVNYLVRFRQKNGKENAIKTSERLHITNCGTSGKAWSPF